MDEKITSDSFLGADKIGAPEISREMAGGNLTIT
jgi:hypothetical protein